MYHPCLKNSSDYLNSSCEGRNADYGYRKNHKRYSGSGKLYLCHELENNNHEHFRADYLLSDNGKYVATSSICKARDEQYQGWGEIMSIYVLPKEL